MDLVCCSSGLLSASQAVTEYSINKITLRISFGVKEQALSDIGLINALNRTYVSDLSGYK